MANQKFQSCLDACKKAMIACDACADACRSEGNVAMMKRCWGLTTDCAEFCKLAIRFMERDSAFTALICEDCAEICRECADECSKHNLQHCKDCAQACYLCMDECLRMSTVPA